MLRGQMLPRTECGIIIFLGSPWLTSAAETIRLGLSLGDFAVHDAAGDILQLQQSHEMAMSDIRQLADRLSTQRKELKLANERLEGEIHDRELVANKLKSANARLEALISNLEGGVLVENELRQVVLANLSFCTIFEIPLSPECLVGADCVRATEQSSLLFADPLQFIARIKEILRHRVTVTGEEITMADGRILTRDYKPIFVGETFSGHLWKYRDVTSQKRIEREVNIWLVM
jgi:PAS domain-containing protein